MKEEFMRLREIEMHNAPPFIWNGEVEYPDDSEYEMGQEVPNLRDLDNLFNLDEDE